MRTCLPALLLLALTAPLWADDDPEPPGGVTKELKALQGKWKLSSLKVGGLGPLPGGAEQKMSLTFTKDKVKSSSEIGGKATEEEMTFKIDPKKKPMHIDITTKKAAKAVPGIYKIEKDELHIAVSAKPDGGTRPKGFAEKDAVIMVLKKEKK